MAIITAHLLHYTGIGLAVCFSAIGVALGQGFAGGGASSAMSRQALALAPVRRGLLLGLAFVESGGIFALLTAIMFFLQGTAHCTFQSALASFGACVSMGITASVVGAALGLVSSKGYGAIARQPLLAGKVTQLMILTQILLEATSVFAFIMVLFVRSRILPSLTVLGGWQLFLCALMVGLGSIGPAMGQAVFSSAACQAIGLNMGMYGRIFSFALITQVMVETPMIFAMIMGGMMGMKEIMVTPLFESCAAMLGAVIVFTIGSFGASTASGNVGAKAVLGMARCPLEHSNIFRLALLSQTIIETSVVYSLIISFLLVLRCH